MIHMLGLHNVETYPWISFPPQWLNYISSSNYWIEYVLSDPEFCIELNISNRDTEHMCDKTHLDLLKCTTNCVFYIFHARLRINIQATKHTLPFGRFNVNNDISNN